MFRYPGGKRKVKSKIVEAISNAFSDNEHQDSCYLEPFFGGGSIGLEIVKNKIAKSIWINDWDVALSSLWSSVIDENKKERLIDLIREFKPTVESFYSFKNYLINSPPKEQSVEDGFMKLAIHQISYSGLGTKSGGPLGGKEQKSKYNISCRWNSDKICQEINKIHNRFKKVKVKDGKCSNKDFCSLISSPGEFVIYLDPPYYEKGGELYQYSFSEGDHERLRDRLKDCRSPWLLSYDECDEIRKMYNWADMEFLSINYTINTSRNKKEFLIFPKEHRNLFFPRKKIEVEFNF